MSQSLSDLLTWKDEILTMCTLPAASLTALAILSSELFRSKAVLSAVMANLAKSFKKLSKTIDGMSVDPVVHETKEAKDADEPEEPEEEPNPDSSFRSRKNASFRSRNDASFRSLAGAKSLISGLAKATGERKGKNGRLENVAAEAMDAPSQALRKTLALRNWALLCLKNKDRRNRETILSLRRTQAVAQRDLMRTLEIMYTGMGREPGRGAQNETPLRLPDIHTPMPSPPRTPVSPLLAARAPPRSPLTKVSATIVPANTGGLGNNTMPSEGRRSQTCSPGKHSTTPGDDSGIDFRTLFMATPPEDGSSAGIPGDLGNPAQPGFTRPSGGMHVSKTSSGVLPVKLAREHGVVIPSFSFFPVANQSDSEFTPRDLPSARIPEEEEEEEAAAAAPARAVDEAEAGTEGGPDDLGLKRFAAERPPLPAIVPPSREAVMDMSIMPTKELVRMTIANSREMHKAERTRLEAEEAAGLTDTAEDLSATGNPPEPVALHKGQSRKPHGKAGSKPLANKNNSAA
mmetsp:Transcript_27797/g.60798  ORF Transcript_27797/g.60798 Transcript_27797/m.60798 type:complete len:517 (+) Transcript_27797:221-1771(+)